MDRRKPNVLVIGPPAIFGPIFHQLSEGGRYRFNFAIDQETAPIYLSCNPCVIILNIPEDQSLAQAALSYLETLRQHAPVVVMSVAADLNLYLAAMNYGAFDYFTSYTPLEEIDRMLDKAINWQQQQVA